MYVNAYTCRQIQFTYPSHFEKMKRKILVKYMKYKHNARQNESELEKYKRKRKRKTKEEEKKNRGIEKKMKR